MTDQERMREIHRQAFLVITILNALEKCVSELQNGFLEGDLAATKETIERLKAQMVFLTNDTENMTTTISDD